jgi:hypothetical protein
MNDQFLKTVYYGGIALAFLVASLSYLWLRGSLAGIAGALHRGRLMGIFRRVIYPTLLLAALAGFFSVSVRGCSGRTYGEIATDHAYIVHRAQDQFSEVLLHLAAALLLWALLIALAIRAARRGTRRRGA